MLFERFFFSAFCEKKYFFQVGFDAGDGLNFYAIEASRTASVINVTKMSNINHPGKFIFRVDTTQITNGGCNVEGKILTKKCILR